MKGRKQTPEVVYQFHLDEEQFLFLFLHRSYNVEKLEMSFWIYYEHQTEMEYPLLGACLFVCVRSSILLLLIQSVSS